MAKRQAQARTEPAAPAVHTAKNTGGYVTVACKLPFTGLELQLCEIFDVEVQGLQGVKTVKESRKTGDKYWIAGIAYPTVAPKNFPAKPYMIDGAAFTPNIPRDFWDAWLSQNAKSEMVRNKMIFAYPQVGHVKGVAKEQRAHTSGLEPMNPEQDAKGNYADRRMPRPTNLAIDRLKQADVARESNSAMSLAEMEGEDA